MKEENEKRGPKPEAGSQTSDLRRPASDRMIRKPANTRDVLGRDFHALADTDGKPKHDHD